MSSIAKERVFSFSVTYCKRCRERERDSSSSRRERGGESDCKREDEQRLNRTVETGCSGLYDDLAYPFDSKTEHSHRRGEQQRRRRVERSSETALSDRYSRSFRSDHGDRDERHERCHRQSRGGGKREERTTRSRGSRRADGSLRRSEKEEDIELSREEVLRRRCLETMRDQHEHKEDSASDGGAGGASIKRKRSTNADQDIPQRDQKRRREESYSEERSDLGEFISENSSPLRRWSSEERQRSRMQQKDEEDIGQATLPVESILSTHRQRPVVMKGRGIGEALLAEYKRKMKEERAAEKKRRKEEKKKRKRERRKEKRGKRDRDREDNKDRRQSQEKEEN